MPISAHIEDMFSRLDQAAVELTSSERSEIQHFADLGEYGLALETAVAIHAAEGKQPSADVVSLFRALATAMHVEPSSLGLS